jgi:hypothetical protein
MVIKTLQQFMNVVDNMWATMKIQKLWLKASRKFGTVLVLILLEVQDGMDPEFQIRLDQHSTDNIL